MPKISKEEIARRINQLEKTGREAGLRMTHQRLEIFREVASTDEHPSPDVIFQRVRKRLPNISHDTVYRTLASLEDNGLIQRIDPICGCARYDANCAEHHHFVCTKCNCISDVYLNQKIPLPEGLNTLGRAESVHVQVRGTCHNCETN